MQRVVVQCDVLIVGGGIAGCMAAIKASEHRSNVVLIEKANTRSSGGAWGGIDDIPVYVPEFHRSRGYAIDNLLQEHCEAVGGLLNKRVQRLILEQSYDRLLDWERFGIKIRDSQGQLRMVKKEEKNLPVWVAVEGRTIKPILTKEMRKRGCKILNRVMAIDILVKANRVAGAVGVSTREEKVFVFLAKSVILATGMTSFIYRNSSGVLYNTIYPNQTGDGRAMAYRAGVELVGMEFKFVRSGPVPLQRGARGASFVGGFFVDRYGNKLDGDPSYDPAKISEMKRNGRGPIFLDCSECTESDLGLTRENLMNEGAAALVQLWDKEGVDIRKEQIEFDVYEPTLNQGLAGILINDKCETSVEGLYAAGAEIGGTYRNVASGAAVLGWNAGEMAANFAKGNQVPSLDDFLKTANDRETTILNMLSRDYGSNWQEVLLSMQNIMSNHAGVGVTESSLNMALGLIVQLRSFAQAKLRARNQHELIHCLEVLNLIDVAEAIILTAKERRESRPKLGHLRYDYPSTNQESVFLIIRKNHDGVTVASRILD